MVPPGNGDDDGASLPRRLIEECLCRAEGSAWGVLGVSDEDMKSHLKMRNASAVLTPTLLNKALSLMQYEGISAIYEACFALTSPSSRAYADFGVSDCSAADPATFPSCRADMATYSSDLEQKRGELRAAATALEASLGRLQDANLAVQQNVTRLMVSADYYTDAMYRVVWHAGSCDLLHVRYEHVRGPLCEGVVNSILAVWALLLVGALLWLLLLLAVAVIIGALTASLPSRRLSWGESEYSLLLDVGNDSPRHGCHGADQENAGKRGAGNGADQERAGNGAQ